MHNLWTVLGFEFVRTIKKRGFWISTLAIPALITVVILISVFSSKTAHKASEQSSKASFSIMVLDQSGLIPAPVLRAVKAQVAATKAAGIAAVQGGKVDAFFYYPANLAQQPVEVYGHDIGLIKNSSYTAIAQQLLESGVTTGIGSPEKVEIIKGDEQTQLTTYAGGKKTKGIERVIAPGAFLVLFYVLIVLLGNQMLSSTTEEKENRVIEMILTTVSSRSLIIGKIVAMMLLGLVQIVVIVVPTLLGYVFFRNSLNIPNFDLSKLVFDPMQMAVGTVLFVCGFLLFTGMLVAIGASMPTSREASRFFGLAMFSMFAPMYAVAAIVTDPSQPIVKIFSFFPLFAPITLMLRNAVGNLSAGETVAGILILLASSVVALAVAVRSFRYGTLQYGRKLTIREMIGF